MKNVDVFIDKNDKGEIVFKLNDGEVIGILDKILAKKDEPSQKGQGAKE